LVRGQGTLHLDAERNQIKLMESISRVWKFGNHIDTDLIIPARFLNVSDKNELAKKCFIDIKPDFAGSIQNGDVIIAGSNFGCGSSREHAPWSIKAAGIKVVIAKSFARIFYRNAFNIGLPILESMDAWELFEEGEQIEVDLSIGKIMNKTNGKQATANPIPGFMMNIIQAGGLVQYIKNKDHL